MARTVRFAVIAAVAAAALALVSCTPKAETPKPQPKVAPPAIAQEGTLTVGVDLATPPYAGTDGGRIAGLDVDVATALAAKLGLGVRFVDVPPSEAATALAKAEVDAVMSVPFDPRSLARVSLAGTYVNDAPAFFVATDSTASVVPSLTVQAVGSQKIGVQTESLAYWLLLDELGEQQLTEFETLREALDALSSGDVDIVAGDAIVGAYIVRDIPTLHFAGLVAPATPLAVAVAAENTELSDAIRAALDELAADGALTQARRTWLGALPEFAADGSEDATTTP
ncbi:MAG: amino acid ABC transporter substrate-binding protein [Actinobacteria bacterium]|nr:MAG: amino acid ABC transporter substrate-binding protein [Actinomycetota bacterium]